MLKYMAILFDLSRIHIRLVLLTIIGMVFFFLYKTVPVDELYNGNSNPDNTDLIYSTILTSIGLYPLNKFNPSSLRGKLIHISHAILTFIIIMI